MKALLRTKGWALWTAMVKLTRHGSDVTSVFDLLGTDENDLTAALGFTLTNCAPLLAALMRRVQPEMDWHGDEARVALEERDSEGRTDLEIQTSHALFICEAKRGWRLPSTSQLRQYTGRIHRQGNGALITLSQASRALAAATLPAQVDGIPLIHLPWKEVLADINLVRSDCRGRERLWLEQLRSYLGGVVRMRRIEDNWTYSVVLGRGRPPGSVLNFREFVTEDLTYFHPYGIKGWPLEPPNFLAFRWDGAVRRIHRVVKADVVPTLLDVYPDLAPEKGRLIPHAVYKLSPELLPPHEPIRNGRNYRTARLWLLLDQLQVSQTVEEALDRTRKLRGIG